ncbi:CotH protein [compost metagenome]
MTGTGSDLVWLDDDPDSYTGLELKSNSHNGNVLIEMLDELNHGTDYEKVINVEESLKYIALNVVTNNTDSYIGGNKQNYYLYEKDGIFSILPWDYNMAFGGLGGGGGMGMGGLMRNQNTDLPPDWQADTEAMTPNDARTEPQADARVNTGTSLLIDEPTQGALAERPLVAKLLAVDEYKEQYHNIITKAIEGYLSEDNFSARVEQLSQMISSYVEQDPTSFYTYEEYQQGVTQLISTNTKQVDNIAQQLDGTIPSSGDGSGSGGGMGGGMGGGRFGAGAARDILTNVNVPPAPDGQADQPQQSPPYAPTEQGAQAQQGVPNARPQQGDRAQQGGRRAPDGMNWGGGMGGGPGEFGQNARQQQGNSDEAVTAGISLLVLIATSVFIVYFRRKRL